MNRQLLGGLALVFLIAVIATSSIIYWCQPPLHNDLTEMTLQLKWFDSGHSAGFYVAQQKGFYEEEGLRINIVPGGFNHPALPPVLSGDADVAVADADLAIIQRSQGKAINVLGAVFNTSLACYISKPQVGIKNPSDLKGHRIGEFPGDITQNVMYVLLHEFDMKQTDVDFVQAGPFEAFLSNEIEVWPSYRSNEPLRMRERNEPVDVLYPEQFGVAFYSDVLVAREDSIMRDRERYARFIRASQRGWAFARDNPNEALELMYQYLSEDRERNLLSREHAGTVIKTLGQFVNDGESDPVFGMDLKRWQSMESQLRAIGKITGPSCLGDLLNDSFLDEQ